jgi:hypothetical protein
MARRISRARCSLLYYVTSDVRYRVSIDHAASGYWSGAVLTNVARL